MFRGREGHCVSGGTSVSAPLWTLLPAAPVFLRKFPILTRGVLQVPVERLVVKEVPVEVEKLIEKVVVKEVPVPVEKLIEKIIEVRPMTS